MTDCKVLNLDIYRENFDIKTVVQNVKIYYTKIVYTHKILQTSSTVRNL